MKLKGPGIDLKPVMEANDVLLERGKAQEDHHRALAQGEALLAEVDPARFLDAKQAILRSEIEDPSSRIDGSRLGRLREATATELAEVERTARNILRIDSMLHRALQSAQRLDQVDVGDLEVTAGQREYFVRAEIVRRIDRVLDGFELIPNQVPAGLADALETIRDNLKADMDTLVTELGDLVRLAPRRPSLRRARFEDPDPKMLPPSRALRPQDVATIEEAATYLASATGNPPLKQSLLDVADRVGERRPELEKLLSAYALLMDEATTAPDYRGGAGPAMHRQAYRARFSAGRSYRQQASRRALAKPLESLHKNRDPIGALEAALIEGFLIETGVNPELAAQWTPKADAVADALAGETLVPLRAFNERLHRSVPKAFGPRARKLALEMTQAVVEGRYHEWRISHDASVRQLDILSEHQRQGWLEPVSVEVEAKPIGDGDPVTLTTSEAHVDWNIFWATKCGGPSHGFDTMTQCGLSLVTNARNTAILVHDPRWPHPAGRTYMRIFKLQKTDEPVLFLEGMAVDFPYPGKDAELRKACLNHAMEKAKSMGIKLILSQNASDSARALGLPLKPIDERYVLAPAALVEAASVFGEHDWIALDEEVRRMKAPQYVLEERVAR